MSTTKQIVAMLGKWYGCLLVFFLFMFRPTDPQACQNNAYRLWYHLCLRTANQADLAISNGNLGHEAIAITNAGYASISGITSEACLDALTQSGRFSIGRHTLLSVHSTPETPLWFAFYYPQSGWAVYFRVNAERFSRMLHNPTNHSIWEVWTLSEHELYALNARAKIKARELLAKPKKANQEIFEAKIFEGHEFRIVTLANLASEGAPYELLRTALFHDHLCPGVTSGYFFIKYLQSFFENQKRFILSVPPWCKDDALIELSNATPGKKSYAVIYLGDQDHIRLRPDARQLAGVFFRKSSINDVWQGMALGFDFEKAKELMGIDSNDMYPWQSRLIMDLGFLNTIANPEMFIQVIPIFGQNVFELEAGMDPSSLVRPGNDALSLLGLWNTNNNS